MRGADAIGQRAITAGALVLLAHDAEAVEDFPHLGHLDVLAGPNGVEVTGLEQQHRVDELVGPKTAVAGLAGVGIDPDREKWLAVESGGPVFHVLRNLHYQRIPQRSTDAKLPGKRVTAEAAAIGNRNRDAMRALGKRMGR